MPEIFGYCGDVTFPVQVLGQVVEQIDNRLFFSEQEKYQSKLEKVRFKVEQSFRKLPKEHQRPFEILYVSRDNHRMASVFLVAKIKLDIDHNVVSECISLPSESGLIIGVRSGYSSLQQWYYEWVGSPYKDPDGVNRTSSSVFSAFCDSLKSCDDPLSGGAPQLVGLYRIGPAKTFGIIYDGELYFNGLPVGNTTSLNCAEWRNRLFERCDGESMDLLKGAQKQPRPNTIKQP